jgi:hypothetical protein
MCVEPRVEFGTKLFDFHEGENGVSVFSTGAFSEYRNPARGEMTRRTV